MAGDATTDDRLIGSVAEFQSWPLRYRIGALGLVALLVAPLVIPVVYVGQMTALIFFMMFAMSWDVVSGYTGQLSLGHAFFIGLGAYSTAILNLQHGVSPLLSIAVATLIAAVGGILIGVPALRLRGPYLALVTLITVPIMVQLFILFSTRLPFIAPEGLGGTSGLTGAPDPLISTASTAIITVPGFIFEILGNYYLALVLMVALFALLFAITRSNAGSIFTAIKEDEEAVAAAGINPEKFKIFAFVLSAAVAGLAGAVFVHTSAGSPLPSEVLSIQLSLNVIIATVIGGIGTIVGAVVGALVVGLTEIVFELDALQYQLPIVNETLSGLYPLPQLLLAILTLFFLPEGIVPANIELGREVLERREGSDRRPAADGGRDEPRWKRSATTLARKFGVDRDDATGARHPGRRRETNATTEEDHE